MDRASALARTQQTRSYCVQADYHDDRAAPLPGFGLRGQAATPLGRAGGDNLHPGVLFSEFPASTPEYFCADFSHPRMRPPPSPFLRTFPDPPTRLNSQPPHDTPIVFPQITSHAPGLTPKPVPDTPARPHPVQIAQNVPSTAILPSPQPSPRTTQKRPHTRFLRFAFPLPHPPYSTPK